MILPTLTRPIAVGILCLLSVLWAGCEPEHLSVEKHAELIAPVLQVEPSDIKLLSYCDYRAGREFFGHKVITSKGILALTDSHIYLMSRNREQFQSGGIVRVPIQDISSLAVEPSQFHLNHNGLLVLIWLNKAPSKQRTQAKYDTVARLFEDQGVSLIEMTQKYEIVKIGSRSRYSSSRFNSGFYSSGSSFNDGFSANYNTSYGSPYTVGGSNDN